MVSLYVGITDYDWFHFLAALPTVDEVNFWQPGGRTNFRALRPGELFLFKLHAPRNFVVGGGVFARADILPGVRLTVSVGVAELTAGMTGEDLFRCADERLYAAKWSGRNTIAA